MKRPYRIKDADMVYGEYSRSYCLQESPRVEIIVRILPYTEGIYTWNLCYYEENYYPRLHLEIIVSGPTIRSVFGQLRLKIKLKKDPKIAQIYSRIFRK